MADFRNTNQRLIVRIRELQDRVSALEANAEIQREINKMLLRRLNHLLTEVFGCERGIRMEIPDDA